MYIDSDEATCLEGVRRRGRAGESAETPRASEVRRLKSRLLRDFIESLDPARVIRIQRSSESLKDGTRALRKWAAANQPNGPAQLKIAHEAMAEAPEAANLYALREREAGWKEHRTRKAERGPLVRGYLHGAIGGGHFPSPGDTIKSLFLPPYVVQEEFTEAGIMEMTMAMLPIQPWQRHAGHKRATTETISVMGSESDDQSEDSCDDMVEWIAQEAAIATRPLSPAITPANGDEGKIERHQQPVAGDTSGSTEAPDSGVTPSFRLDSFLATVAERREQEDADLDSVPPVATAPAIHQMPMYHKHTTPASSEGPHREVDPGSLAVRKRDASSREGSPGRKIQKANTEETSKGGVKINTDRAKTIEFISLLGGDDPDTSASSSSSSFLAHVERGTAGSAKPGAAKTPMVTNSLRGEQRVGTGLYNSEAEDSDESSVEATQTAIYGPNTE